MPPDSEGISCEYLEIAWAMAGEKVKVVFMGVDSKIWQTIGGQQFLTVTALNAKVLSVEILDLPRPMPNLTFIDASTKFLVGGSLSTAIGLPV